MKMYHEIITDSKTGKNTEIKREFTVAELNKIEQDNIANTQQESKKQSAIAKLKALGLDEEEVKAILGV
jgi:hypothetical protein